MSITLRSDRVTATVLSVDGGRLASLRIGDRELLVARPPGVGPGSTMWGCFVMAPWAGRLDEGALPWRGVVHQMRRNNGAHSIHGLVFDAPWEVQLQEVDAVTLHRTLDDLWPLSGGIRHHITLSPGGLSLRLDVRAGAQGMPLGAGWHPWFARAQEDLRVTVDADATLVTTADLIPTGDLEPVGGDRDLRGGPPLGERRLDHVYARARPPTLLRWPDLELRMEFRPPLETVVVYTPEGAACVEPQCAWPNAPSLAARGVGGSGLVALGPDEEVTLETRWSWS